MPVPPAEALEIAARHVARERIWATVTGLLEDSVDYFVVLEAEQWPLGPGPLFVAKATGQVWSDAYGNVLDKIDAMEPCPVGEMRAQD